MGGSLPQIRTWCEQIKLHLHDPGQCLQQINLHWGEIAEAKESQAFWQWRGRGLPHAQQINRPLNLQAEGIAGEAVGELTNETRLPAQDVRKAVSVISRQPARQLLRSVKRVIIDGISQLAGKQPLLPRQSVRCSAVAVPPLSERVSLLKPHQLWQHIKHRPDQPFGSPGIVNGGGCAQHGLHQLPQTASRKREAHESADPVDAGELFSEPTACGPGIDHHLHLFKGVGRVEVEVLGEELSQKLRSVAAINPQQGSPVARMHWTAEPSETALGPWT